MASCWAEIGQEEDPRSRSQGYSGADEDKRREARLVGERIWPGFEFIDVVAHNEGEFVGFHLGTPYDWDILDPALGRGDDE